VLSCLEKLQELDISNYQINDVILLGGAACKTRYEQLSTSVLRCNIYNVYSNNDNVLKIPLKYKKPQI